MRFHLSFRWKIFALYAVLVSLLILGLTVSTYIYFSNALTKNANDGMNQSVKRISQQTDSFLANMNDITKIVLYNLELQKTLFDAMNFPDTDQNYFDINLEEKRKVNGILFTIMGTKEIPRRVNIFNGRRNIISLSTIPGNTEPPQADLTRLPWIPLLHQSDVYAITLPPHADVQGSPLVVSFIRKVTNTSTANTTTLGYVEVQQPYSMIENIVKPSLFKNARIYVADDQGRLIYPIDSGQAAEFEYYYSKGLESSSKERFSTHNQRNGKAELVYTAKSEMNGWTVLQVIPLSEFTGSARKFQVVLFLVSILLLAITLSLMYVISVSLTSPLRQLHKSLKNVSLQTPFLHFDVQSNHNELVWFTHALNKTLQRLQETMKQTIEARSKEVEAHFQALQAQIDPHFLYNSLMGISSVAQEEGSPKVEEMCFLLSRMLRYAGSYDSSIVALEDEIRNAECYIQLYKFRYEDDLDYEFELDPGILAVQVPKLVLQPLIENSFNHAFTRIKPPYRLRVQGKIENNRWMLTVSDNGPGFSPEAIENIQERMKQYDQSLENYDYENKLEIGGMAIFNVYIRLKMIVKEPIIFEISNHEDAGASVTFGGKFI